MHLVEENHDRISKSRLYAAQKTLEVGLEDKIFSSHDLMADFEVACDSDELMGVM